MLDNKGTRKAFEFLVSTWPFRRATQRFWPPVTKTVAGMVFKLNPGGNVSERRAYLTGGAPEPRSIETLVERVRGRRALCLDVGANFGFYSLSLARAAGEGSRVRAFEPSETMRGRLLENIRRNGLGDVVEVNSCALGARDGTLPLRVNRANHGQASLKPHEGLVPGAEVEVRTLASFLGDAADYEIVVLKIDVEGYEGEVLAPLLEEADATLWPTVILLETDHAEQWSTDLRAMLHANGYAPIYNGEGNTIYARDRPAETAGLH